MPILQNTNANAIFVLTIDFTTYQQFSHMPQRLQKHSKKTDLEAQFYEELQLFGYVHGHQGRYVNGVIQRQVQINDAWFSLQHPEQPAFWIRERNPVDKLYLDFGDIDNQTSKVSILLSHGTWKCFRFVFDHAVNEAFRKNAIDIPELPGTCQDLCRDYLRLDALEIASLLIEFVKANWFVLDARCKEFITDFYV